MANIVIFDTKNSTNIFNCDTIESMILKLEEIVTRENLNDINVCLVTDISYVAGVYKFSGDGDCLLCPVPNAIYKIYTPSVANKFKCEKYKSYKYIFSDGKIAERYTFDELKKELNTI